MMRATWVERPPINPKNGIAARENLKKGSTNDKYLVEKYESLDEKLCKSKNYHCLTPATVLLTQARDECDRRRSFP